MSNRLHRQDKTLDENGDQQTYAQRDAQERQANRDARGAQEQLAVLDARLGAGVGAARERARLQTLVSA